MSSHPDWEVRAFEKAAQAGADGKKKPVDPVMAMKVLGWLLAMVLALAGAAIGLLVWANGSQSDSAMQQIILGA